MSIQKLQLTLESLKLFIGFSNFLPFKKPQGIKRQLCLTTFFSFLIFSLGDTTTHDL